MKKKEINVLYIITKLELGGAQKVCLSLLNGLRKTGNKALLVTGNQGQLVQTLEDDDQVYFLKNFKREVTVAGIVNEVINFFQLFRFIRSLKKKHPKLVVHTHSTKAGLLGRWAALLAGIKTRIHTVHGFGFHPYQNKFGWLINYFLELVTSCITTHYVCVSSFDVKTGITMLPFFSKKHSIIRASVDQQRFLPAHVQPTQKVFTFGTISCFKKQKNLFDLLHAFKHCNTSNQNTRLEIIGDGQLRQEIESWIKKNNLQESISLLGWQNNVATKINTWNAFVLSSLWEGLPCAVVEARLAKLPVLAYDTGGIHDIICHGHNGYLYKPQRWEDLANGMLELSQSPSLYKKLREYHDDLSDFDLTSMINQHIELYDCLN